MQDAAVRAIRSPPGAAGWGQGTTVASLAVPDRPTSDAASWIVCFGKRRYTRWSGIRVVMRKESTAKFRGSRDDEVSSRGKETLLFESFALFPLLGSFRSGNLLGPMSEVLAFELQNSSIWPFGGLSHSMQRRHFCENDVWLSETRACSPANHCFGNTTYKDRGGHWTKLGESKT